MRTRRDEIRGLDWYARNPEHALDGMQKMTPEQKGIYNDVLDRIYMTGDRLVDDDRRLAALNNCDVRVYRRIKAYLLAEGKIFLETVDGTVYIRNQPASNEVSKGRMIVLAKALAGAEGGRASAAIRATKSNKNNGTEQSNGAASAQASAQHTYNNNNKNLSDRESTAPARDASAPAPQGARADATPDIRRHPSSAVRAMAETLNPVDLAAWIAYRGEIAADGKSFIIEATSEARADLIESRFGTRLRATLKTYTLKAPGMQDRKIP